MRFSIVYSICVVGLALGCQSSKVSTEGPAASAPQNLPSVAPNFENVIERFAFSCCAYQRYAQPIWKTILQKHPDLYIGMGDNVYSSLVQDRSFSEAYKTLLQIHDFVSFRALSAITSMAMPWSLFNGP